MPWFKGLRGSNRCRFASNITIRFGKRQREETHTMNIRFDIKAGIIRAPSKTQYCQKTCATIFVDGSQHLLLFHLRA